MVRAASGCQNRFLKLSLEDLAPTNHLLRKIYSVLDRSWLRAKLNPLLKSLGFWNQYDPLHHQFRQNLTSIADF